MTYDPDCFTANELAARWKLSVRTLERWRAQRYGPAWITIGGSIRYRMTDVQDYENQNRNVAVSPTDTNTTAEGSP